MFIFYILPAIGWGIMPIIAALTKAKPINQLLGTAIMAFIFGGLFFWVEQPILETKILLFTFLSGCFWGIGQYLQFYSFQMLPVSEAMPFSNGTQLIGTTVIAALLFKEWSSFQDFLLGVCGIVTIILGIICISYKETKSTLNQLEHQKKAILYLLISSGALIMYVILPRIVGASGASVIFPQSIGMLTIALFLGWHERKQVNNGEVLRNLTTGFCWSVANLSLFITIPLLGVAQSFTFSQLAVLISLGGGLLIFKVKKTTKERIVIIIGALELVVGIILIGSIKK